MKAKNAPSIYNNLKDNTIPLKICLIKILNMFNFPFFCVNFPS